MKGWGRFATCAAALVVTVLAGWAALVVLASNQGLYENTEPAGGDAVAAAICGFGAAVGALVCGLARRLPAAVALLLAAVALGGLGIALVGEPVS